MFQVRRRLAATIVGSVFAVGAVAGPALAGDYCPPPPPPSKAKCNSGNGNGSESTVSTGHCTNGDPGNSWAAGNRGGDETSFPGSASNPGGNNVP